MTLQWQPGFDGGSEQTFTIVYIDTSTSQNYSVRGIEDSVGGNMLTYDVKQGIFASDKYLFWITARNDLGSSPAADTEAETPGTIERGAHVHSLTCE